MAFGAKIPPTGPYSAAGTVTNVEARTKAKKAGGTYTVNIVTLNTGVEVDFGFKTPPVATGDTVNFEVMKEYGAYKYKSDSPAPGLPAAFPARGSAASGVGAGAPSGGTGGGGSRGSFPIAREDYQTSIIRQNALTNAVKAAGDILSNLGYAHLGLEDELTAESYSDAVIRLAYKFASFSSGQYDDIVKAEAEKKVSGAVPLTAKKAPKA